MRGGIFGRKGFRPPFPLKQTIFPPRRIEAGIPPITTAKHLHDKRNHSGICQKAKREAKIGFFSLMLRNIPKNIANFANA